MRFVRLLSLLALTSTLSACITLDQIEPSYPSEDQDAVMQRMVARESYQRSQSDLDARLQGRVDPVTRHTTPHKEPSTITPYEKQLQITRGRLFDLCLDKKNMFYYAHTPCTANEISSKDLYNDTRPSFKERQAIDELFQTMQGLNQAMLKVMKQSGNPTLVEQANTSIKSVQPKIKALQKAFVDGQLTWGQYNQRRLELYKATRQ